MALSSFDLENIVVTLENDREFSELMEQYAASIAPSFYRLQHQIGSRYDVDFDSKAFMKYTIKEIYNVRVADSLTAALKRHPYLGIDDLYGDDRAKVVHHFTSYYKAEIMLGNSFIPETNLKALRMRYIDGTTKKAACVAFGGSMYKFNELLNKFPEQAFKRFLLVHDDRKPYKEVMKEAYNLKDIIN